MDGEFLTGFHLESAWMVRTRMKKADCRPGVDFLKISREIWVRPLQRSSARFFGNSGGTAEIFALS